MSNLHVECYGGPMDGKKLAVPRQMVYGDPGDNACMIHLDHGEPHFYVLSQRVDHDTLNTYEVLEYAGTDPMDTIPFIRQRSPELADQIEKELRDSGDNEIPFLFEDEDEAE
ncbi:hypothetical protein EBZ39_00645 [bacterium]|nr:hypothetical protein [bacterium]